MLPEGIAMATVFRPTYTRRTPSGEKIQKKLRKWYVRYRNAAGNLKTVVGLTDKQATKDLARELERAALLERLGLENPFAEHDARSLEDHLDDYRECMRALGRTRQHRRETCRMVEVILHRCGFEKWRDISASRFIAYLSTIRESRSVRTHNKHVTAFSGFCRWMVADGRAAKNPVSRVKKIPETDRVFVRRALDMDEFCRLLGVASASHGDRYVTAAYTGLRAGEMGALTRDRLSFSLRVLRAGGLSRKRKKNDVLPLHAAVTERLAGYRDLDPAERLWPGQWWRRAAEMLRSDLDAAEIPYENEAGRFDFHALRGQFSTAMIRAGVPLAAAQKLMRHSTPDLTANAYTHLEVEDLRAELAKLPYAPLPEKYARGTHHMHSGLTGGGSQGRAEAAAGTDSDSSEDQDVQGNRTQVQGDSGDGPSRIRTCNQRIMSPLGRNANGHIQQTLTATDQPGTHHSTHDRRLGTLISAWPHLPESLRDVIVAICRGPPGSRRYPDP